MDLRDVKVCLFLFFADTPEHSVDSSTLLLVVRVYIQVERRAHIGMAEYRADGLYVAFRSNETRGKGMAQAMKFYAGQL